MLLINLTKEVNLTRVVLPINTSFARFLLVLQFSLKNFNGFKVLNIFTKSAALDV